MNEKKTGTGQFGLNRMPDIGLLPGIPLVEISGDRRVLIEHHQGVVAYGCNEICVRVRYGVVSVCGCGLNLARMTREQLVICGRIDSVRLVKRGDGI